MTSRENQGKCLWKRGFAEMGWRLGVVTAAGAAALVPLPAVAVERAYSTSLYLVFQPIVTALSNGVPFALLDVVLLAAAAGWLVAGVRDVGADRGVRVRALLRIARRTLVGAAITYLVFLLTWGLNYRRVGLADKLRLADAATASRTARALALTAADRLNALRTSSVWRGADVASMPDAGAIPPALAAAFARVQRELGATRLAQPARPKRTWLEPYLRRTAVQGLTDPFFLETLVEADLLPVERSFVVAHEWSHLAGYAGEGEANFVGWLTCLHGSEADQYSGWLFLYAEVVRGLGPARRVEADARLAAGPRADLGAIAHRIARSLNPRLSAAGWRVYDRYLKANRVESGTASYADVVRLVLGAQFTDDWVPLMNQKIRTP